MDTEIIKGIFGILVAAGALALILWLWYRDFTGKPGGRIK